MQVAEIFIPNPNALVPVDADHPGLERKRPRVGRRVRLGTGQIGQRQTRRGELGSAGVVGPKQNQFVALDENMFSGKLQIQRSVRQTPLTEPRQPIPGQRHRSPLFIERDVVDACPQPTGMTHRVRVVGIARTVENERAVGIGEHRGTHREVAVVGRFTFPDEHPLVVILRKINIVRTATGPDPHNPIVLGHQHRIIQMVDVLVVAIDQDVVGFVDRYRPAVTPGGVIDDQQIAVAVQRDHIRRRVEDGDAVLALGVVSVHRRPERGIDAVIVDQPRRGSPQVRRQLHRCVPGAVGQIVPMHLRRVVVENKHPGIELQHVGGE